ncbi:MAG TPA: hypothetical protein VIL03_02215 [Clostridia bacterium]|jgi:predicted RNA-binding Zn-ribbon protein involved in translation (DUF1610 family)
MPIINDYNKEETTDLSCPKCGSFNIVSTSSKDDMLLCSDCGFIFGSNIPKDEDQNY